MAGIALSQPGGVGAINTAGANPPVLQEVYLGIQCYPTFTGSTTTWTWSVTAKPVGSNASFSSPSGVRPVSTPNLQAPFFTCDKAGNYTIQFVDSGANTYTMNLAAAASSPPYPVLSVKDFGAKGDGINDDTAAILATAARVQALGGGVVYFPGGRYPIVVPSLHFINYNNVTFRGEGQYVSLLVDLQGRAPDSLVYPTFGGTATGENAFLTFTDSTNCVIERLGFQGSATYVQGDIGRDAVGRKGIYSRVIAAGVRNFYVRHCYFTLIEGEVFYGDGNASLVQNNVHFDHNHVYRCMSNGFNLGVAASGSNNCSGDDNVFEDCGGSPAMFGGIATSFSRNKISMPSGFSASSDQILVVNALQCKVEDNIIRGILDTATGVAVINIGFSFDSNTADISVRRNLISRCRVLNNTVGSHAGIIVLSASTVGATLRGVVVESNDIVECSEGDHVNYPIAQAIRFIGTQGTSAIVQHNNIDNRGIANGLAIGVGIDAGVDASNGIVLRQNFISSDVATPYSLNVAPLANETYVTGLKTWDPPNVVNATQTTTTVTVTGAAVGGLVSAGFSNSLQGMVLTGFVSAANTVTVVLRNDTGGPLDLASGTLRARCTKS